MLYTMWQSEGRIWVWRIPGERYLPAYVLPTVIFGGGGITLWVLFFMEWTWPSCNTAWKCKCRRVGGHFDPLHTVYGRRPMLDGRGARAE
jgi:hypothetical protein